MEIYPKTEYEFRRAGELTLEIRDVTLSSGDSGMLFEVADAAVAK